MLDVKQGETMTKRRSGGYLGGSTVLSSTGRGFSYDPGFPTRKRKRRKASQVDRSYAAPPFTPAEVAENDRLKAELLGSPGLITKEQIKKMKRPRKRHAYRS
jgi:hypothetical protein